MAEDKELTAEQQLLALIEGQDGKKEGAEQPKTAKAAKAPQTKAQTKRGDPMFSVDALRGRISFIQENLVTGFKNADIDVTLKLVNSLLIICICGMFIFLGVQVASKPKKIDLLPEMMTVKKTAKTAEEGGGYDFTKDLMYYMEKLKVRDIFKPKVKEEPKVVEVVKEPVITINDTIKDLKLVGLAPSENPAESFAMIENLKTNTTNFIKEGDSILGLTVMKIADDRVVMSNGSETTDLR